MLQFISITLEKMNKQNKQKITFKERHNRSIAQENTD